MFTTESIPALCAVGLQRVVKVYEEDTPSQFTAFTQGVGSIDQRQYRMRQVSGFGYAPIKGQGNNIAFDTILSPYTKDAIPEMRGLGFEMTVEAKYTDYYSEIANSGPKLVRSLDATLEQACANILNNGFTGTSGIDALSLFNAAHPIAGTGGTQSNTSTLTFGPLNLETLRLNVFGHQSIRGIPMKYSGQLNLILPLGLSTTAERYLASTLLPTTAQNDANVIRKYVTAHTNHFLTSTTAWFLVPAKESDRNILLIRRVPRTAESWYDNDKKVYKASLHEEYCIDWCDWRFMAASTGA